MRALFIVLSALNDDCSLNTCLILNNEWYETTPRTWKDKNNILGVLEEPLDQNRELARPSGSVERATNSFWIHSVYPLDQPKSPLGRASWSSDHQTSSVSFYPSKASSNTLCTSSLITINTNNFHEYFTTINHT